jgi:uncharacterized protein involved in propanediol utilization
MHNKNPRIIEKIFNNDLHKHNPFDSVAIGSANGTFGEILQGILPNDDHFLVTFPINCLSRCIIIKYDSPTLEIYPPHKKKSLLLAEHILKHFNLSLRGKMIIKSDISEGKGLASSSADMVATSRALESMLNIKISNDLLLYFLRQIEPTDGVMYPGFVSFYHRKVELRENLGHLPAMTIVGIDEGGMIDTIEYNKKNKSFNTDDMKRYEVLLNQVSTAIHAADLKTIGLIATKSALLNQNHNPKKYLQAIMDICETVKGLGVLVAHSGTCIGIIFDNSDSHYRDKVQQATASLRELNPIVMTYESINYMSNVKEIHSSFNSVKMEKNYAH